MSSILRGNMRMAVSAVRTNKWRSMLTTLGIIIGIVSVVTVVGIGEGVKHQIAGQISHFGDDIITIRPGGTSQTAKNVAKQDILFGLGAVNGLGEQDLRAVQSSQGVRLAAPLSVVPGAISAGDRVLTSGRVIATNSNLPDALNKSVRYGDFFSEANRNQNTAVIGKNVAINLFDDLVPLGQRFTFRGETFLVRGMFDDFKGAPNSPTASFNDAIFIPFEGTAERLTGNNAQIYTILAKPVDRKQLPATMKAIDVNMLKSRGGQRDFQVLSRDQLIASGSDVLNLLTAFIAGIAGISLVVGGVGIMNIMLLTVTERMHEIGVRKAVGATSRQIMLQFLTESIVLSVSGGLLGSIMAVAINGFLYLYTDFKPVVSWHALAIAAGVSVAIGIIFGTAPALKAARKDPIQALRHE